MNAAFHTLGCRLNQADTAAVAGDLARNGWTVVPEPAADTDLIVLNSCSVTATAARKSRQTLRAFRRRFPSAFIVLMGCDASVERAEVFPEADLILPNPRLKPLSALLPVPFRRPAASAAVARGPFCDDFTCEGAGLFAERTRANLKVQDGCSFFCSYCIVPSSRGPARSRQFDDVLREARALIAQGHREIVLTGVNITTYDSGGNDLADLLEALLALDGTVRYRLGSAEPGPVIGKVIGLMARRPRLCRFLHLPLQYGEDGILKAMNRHYDTARFREIAEEASLRLPGLCLGTDIIVGFPGETDRTFEACCAYLRELPFGLMHVFAYSPRPGTPAAAMPGRPSNALAERRLQTLLALSAEKADAFAASQVGRTLPVLIEQAGPSSGWSDNYLHVTLEPPDDGVPANTLCRAVVTSAASDRRVSARRVP